MPRSLLTVLVFAKLNTKRFFRDKTALFFSIMFPLIFLFVFGSIFGSTSSTTFTVALINKSDSEIAKQFEKQIRDGKISAVKFKVDQEATDQASAQQKMIRGQIDALLTLPQDFGTVGPDGIPTGKLELQYTQNNAQAAQTLGAVLDGVLTGINDKYVATRTPFTVDAKQIAQQGQSAFDYTFTGLLGFAIIGLGIFGPINVFPELKKQGILRRLHTTPLRVWQYFTAMSISQSIQGLASVGVLFAVAIAMFDLHVKGNFIEIALYVVLSIILILGIGLALGGWAKNERQAAPLSNIVVFPLMFLSGTFFPRFLMPEWLQTVSAFLPLTPVIDGLRLMIAEGQHLTNLLPQLGMMAAWMVVIYLIAFRVFRWE